MDYNLFFLKIMFAIFMTGGLAMIILGFRKWRRDKKAREKRK